jgi:hypothetical protein
MFPRDADGKIKKASSDNAVDDKGSQHRNPSPESQYRPERMKN